ncbi:hypothetical protein ACFLUG_03400 [Chloroflexota bacterium]
MVRILIVLMIMALVVFPCLSCKSPSENSGIREHFDDGSLDLSQWEVTRDGEFSEAVVDVVDVDDTAYIDYRLRLRANTLNTSTSYKFLGIRSIEEFGIDPGKKISFDIDWNNQSNGCYLLASVYLCPEVSNNPKNGSNWLKFEYVGVPPGKNVRINIREKVNGLIHELYTDWGPYNEDNRPVGLPLGENKHRVEITLNTANLQVFQDGEELISDLEHSLNFDSGYLYLQLGSGTNYPGREVYFDNIVVEGVAIRKQPQ